MIRFFLGAALLATASTAFALDAEIRGLSFSGTGCSAADSSGRLYDINGDNLPDEFILMFSNYIAQQGPGISAGLRARDCKIMIHLKLPRDRQFAITSVRYEGYADLPAGVQGVQRSQYQFPSIGTRTLQTVLNGPYSDIYDRTDNLGANALWSKCGPDIPFMIRTEARLAGDRSQNALLTTDQVAGLVIQRYRIAWRSCSR